MTDIIQVYSNLHSSPVFVVGEGICCPLGPQVFELNSGWDSALEATQGQIDGIFSQLPYKFHLEEVASLGD